MRKQINNIFFAVGLISIAIMFMTFDVSLAQLWCYIKQAQYWIVAILALWLALYMLNALAWQTIIKDSGAVTVSFAKLLKLTITGFTLNATTPVGLVGGEAYRVLELSKYIGVQRATSSVVLFAMMHIFSHFWFWLTSVAVYVVLALAGDLPFNAPIAIVLAFAVVFCAGGIYLFLKGYKNGMVVKFIRLVSKIPGLRKWGERFAESRKEDLKKIDEQISQLHEQNRRSFLTSFFMEYFGRIFQSFEIFFMLMLFGIDSGGGLSGMLLTFLHSFLILAFTSLFANLLGFLPLQLGGREGGFAMSVAQMGMSGGIGMFISIICRVREFFWIGVGLLLMKL